MYRKNSLLSIVVLALTTVSCLPFQLVEMSDQIVSRGEVVLERIPLSEDITGKRVDFTGIQVYAGHKGYNNTMLYKYYTAQNIFPPAVAGSGVSSEVLQDKLWDVTIQFMETFDKDKRNRLTVIFDESGCCMRLCSRPIVFDANDYMLLFRDRQKPVIDDNSCFSLLPYEEGAPGKMSRRRISSIKKNSNADYFLVFAVRPLELWIPDKEHKGYVLNIALITAMYDWKGKKVYSEIYTESLEHEYSGRGLYYDCIMLLLKNHGKQIDKDLSFLNNAAIAEYPTLEDVHIQAYNITERGRNIQKSDRTEMLYLPKRQQ